MRQRDRAKTQPRTGRNSQWNQRGTALWRTVSKMHTKTTSSSMSRIARATFLAAACFAASAWAEQSGDGDWPMAAHDYASTRFSPLVEIRSEEHTSELQSPCNLVCRLLLEKK